MSQASAAAAPLYAAHNDALSGGVSGSSASAVSASSSISTSGSTTSGGGPGSGSGLGGLTASSLVTAAIGKQSLGLNYEAFSSSSQQQSVAKSRSSVSYYLDFVFLI